MEKSISLQFFLLFLKTHKYQNAEYIVFVFISVEFVVHVHILVFHRLLTSKIHIWSYGPGVNDKCMYRQLSQRYRWWEPVLFCLKIL